MNTYTNDINKILVTALGYNVQKLEEVYLNSPNKKVEEDIVEKLVKDITETLNDIKKFSIGRGN